MQCEISLSVFYITFIADRVQCYALLLSTIFLLASS